MGSAIGGSSALHAPHRPRSARCLAGARFSRPHTAQRRIMSLKVSIVGARSSAPTSFRRYPARAEAKLRAHVLSWPVGMNVPHGLVRILVLGVGIVVLAALFRGAPTSPRRRLGRSVALFGLYVLLAAGAALLEYAGLKGGFTRGVRFGAEL